MEIKEILHKFSSKRSFTIGIHSLLSVILHLRDGRTDIRRPSVRPSLRWSDTPQRADARESADIIYLICDAYRYFASHA